MAQTSAGDEAPALGELRPAVDIYAEPARSLLPPSDLSQEADFIAVIRVDEVSTSVTSTFHSEVSGNDISTGRAVIEATVVKSIKGASGEVKLGQSILFQPNQLGEEPTVAVPAASPPLEAGREYLVLVADGQLLFPGGIFAVHGGKVWDIGFWTDAQARDYPPGLSGTKASALDLEVVAAAMRLETR